MNTQNIPQISTTSTVQEQTVVLLLNSIGFEPYIPEGGESNISLQVIAHNWVHLAQDNKH